LSSFPSSSDIFKQLTGNDVEAEESGKNTTSLINEYFKRKLVCREKRLSNKNSYGGAVSSMIK